MAVFMSSRPVITSTYVHLRSAVLHVTYVFVIFVTCIEDIVFLPPFLYWLIYLNVSGVTQRVIDELSRNFGKRSAF